MSQYPVFSVSPFPTNTNQLPFNLSQNNSIPAPVTPFQQNANMSFLSFPPPSLPGSHHVFQSGPRFPGAINTMQPTVFATSSFGNPSMMASSVFSTNIPNGNINSPLPFTSNIPNGNINSPLPFTSNSTFSALTSVPPPQVAPMWQPTCFNNTQLPTFVSGSPNFRDAGSIPGNFQQTPQKVNAQSLNPWSPASSNNFQASTSNSINPWAVDPSKANSNFNTFQSGSNTSNQTVQKYVSPWASEANSSNFSHNFQGTQIHMKESPSKFIHSKSPAGDINPWVQPPTISTSSATDKYQLSNEHGRHYQNNFGANKFSKPNYNNRRGNSRLFSNNNYTRQDRNFKGERSFKRESNESKPHSCDTCDRSFASECEFRDHMADHIKCNFKDCHFEAHPKIVALHKRMQHDTGYADAINKLKNADEIEKWRAERRRRFPTAANILKRKAEQAEKEARGEVIENKEFGKFKKQNTGQREQKNNRFANRKRSKNNKNNRMNASIATGTALDSESDSDDDSHIKLRKFSGILAATDVFNPIAKESSLIHNSPEKSGELIENALSESSKKRNLDSHLQKEAEENEESPLNSKKIKSLDESIKGSVSSNPINIGSDDDAPIELAIVKNINDDEKSEDESPIEIPVSKVPLNGISNSTSKVAKNLLPSDAKKNVSESDDDSPVEIPVSKVPLNEISNSASVAAKNKPHTDSKKVNTEVKEGRDSSKAEHHKKNWNRKNEPHSVNPVKKSSLLEKLLADDIRHERNVIMQCIRHIVKKKFFGIGSDA